MKITSRLLQQLRRVSPRCCDAACMLSFAADQRPTWVDRMGLQAHLLLCSPCRRYKQSLTFLERTMKGIAELPAANSTQSLSLEARERIHNVLGQVQSDL